MAKVDHAAAVDEAIALLAHPRSPQRRTGAKRLRRLRDPRAGAPLLDALRREVQDPRTWETQYHLIMALGECGYREALPYLRELTTAHFEATMVYVALGDAIVRLAREHENDPAPVLALLGSGNDMLVEGAFRAVALLRLTLTEQAVRDIIAFASARGPDHHLRFWVIAAAAGWRGPHVEAFLLDCRRGGRPDFQEAVDASLAHRYLRWRPL